MPNFKDYMLKDINVFFNIDELGEDHKIDDENKTIIVDNELLKERQAKYADGAYIGDILFFIKKSDFGEEPAIEQHIKFDGETMKVMDFNENDSIYEITLGAYMS